MNHDDAVQHEAVQDDARQELPAQAAGGSTAEAAPKPGPAVSGAPKPGPAVGGAPQPGPAGQGAPDSGEGSDPGTAGTEPARPGAGAGSGLVTPPAVATKEPPTGDVVVDAVLDEFDRVTGEPLDAHVEVGEKVHRTLQARLADLGDE